MIALVNSGVGNLRSVEKALTTVGADVLLTSKKSVIEEADKVVLPGVGAFGDTLRGLHDRDLSEVLPAVVKRGTPLLGICVGMQVLFDGSDELGDHAGFGFIKGRVRRFSTSGTKVPQTGWNQLDPVSESLLLKNLPAGSYVYFNHSYYCDAVEEDDILAFTEYGIRYASVIQRKNLYGVQFHPEKSQVVGLAILRNFVEYC